MPFRGRQRLFVELIRQKSFTVVFKESFVFVFLFKLTQLYSKITNLSPESDLQVGFLTSLACGVRERMEEWPQGYE